jgi:hypothetical protein
MYITALKINFGINISAEFLLGIERHWMLQISPSSRRSLFSSNHETQHNESFW